MTTRGWLAATSDPGSLRKHCKRLSAPTYNHISYADYSYRHGSARCGRNSWRLSDESTRIYCEARLQEATNTPANTTRVAPTPRGSTPPTCHIGPAFPTCSQLPASAHRAAQPPDPQQQDHARPRAGRHSRTKSTLCTASIDANHPTNAPHLGTGSLPAAPRPTACRRPAPRPPSSRCRPRKRRRNPPSRVERRRRLHRPAAQQPRAHLPILSQRPHAQGCWGLCRTAHPHRAARSAAETENRFGRAGAPGRPAGMAGRTQRSAPKSPRIEVRTEKPSGLVTTATSAQAQPSGEHRGRRAKQQHGIGQQCPSQKMRERVGGGRRTS